MDDPALHITKLDAAKRQLLTAIQLWFAEGDPVSIHTLAAAVHEIVHVLARRAGQKGLIFDSSVVKEEHRGPMNKALMDVASFFKHARNDPEGTIDFKPALNDWLLVVSVTALNRMGHDLGAEGKALSWWMFLHRPHVFADGERTKLIPVDVLQNLRNTGKSDFLQTMKVLHELGWPHSDVAS